MSKIKTLGIIGNLHNESYNTTNASTKSGREMRAVTLLENDVRMLRVKLESMTNEVIYLKKIADAAALLVARMDRVSLHDGTATAAFTLAGLIGGMPEEMVSAFRG